MLSKECSLITWIVTFLLSVALLPWPSQGLAVPTAPPNASVTDAGAADAKRAYKAAAINAGKTDLVPKTPIRPQYVYRGTWISPEMIRKTGGILPNLMGKPLDDWSYSLNSHAEGIRSTVYVSTSLSFGVACRFAIDFSTGPNRYIYQIKATPNMIDLIDSGYNEQEFAALGGILYDQIIGYLSLPKEAIEKYELYDSYKKLHANYPESRWIHNGGFNEKYGGLVGSPPQPQLLKPGGVDGELKSKTAKQYAHEFMNSNGAIVGWDGHFPLPGLRKTLTWDKRSVGDEEQMVRLNRTAMDQTGRFDRTAMSHNNRVNQTARAFLQH